ncbi:regulator of telomere elongation helicase 1-like isoform X2 [Dysidea avara]
MEAINIRGIPVHFPLNPYPCQISYMERVILALEKEKNAILESPTGTGKTLCLLCATLAWREHQKRNRVVQEPPTSPEDEPCNWGHQQPNIEDMVPKVIYASRTHSQLSQVIRELKNTIYNPRVAIIGSRDQLCVHPEVSSKENNAEKIHLCRAKINSESCSYYKNFTLQFGGDKTIPNSTMDIEDLVQNGRQSRFCPYFLSRKMSKSADLIFMPYNYIIDRKLRRVHGIDLDNVILILDEAHNVPKACEEAESFEISSKHISLCIADLKYLFDKIKEKRSEYIDEENDHEEDLGSNAIEDIANIRIVMDKLEEGLDKLALDTQSEMAKDGSFLLEFLSRAGIKDNTVEILTEQCEKITEMLTKGGSGAGGMRRSGTNIQYFIDFVQTVFGSSPEEQARYFRVFIKQEAKQKDKSSSVWTVSVNSSSATRTINYWCFSAGYSMSAVAGGAKSVILTSGTLKPLNSFVAELRVSFPVTLENPHVVDGQQAWVGVAKVGPDNVPLNSSYAQRGSTEYRRSLGNTIVNLSRVIPHGVLVFFSSYGLMNSCFESWKECDILQNIELHKPVFLEPKQKSKLQPTMDSFYEKINDPQYHGAIFFAVCRGKVSEGLDFIDANGRAVIITGIPYPPRMDPKVKMKMDYLDTEKSCTSQGLSGEQWYRQQATRAVNQAVGRVIRHKNDYGAIILCDERFSHSDTIRQLPQWLVPYARIFSTFGSLLKDLIRFFKSAETRFGGGKPAVVKAPTGQANEASVSSVTTPPSVRPPPSHKQSMKGIQKASTVDIHVANERPPASLAKLQVQYEEDKSLLPSLLSAEVTKPKHSVVMLHSSATIEGSSKLSDQIFKSSSSSSTSCASAIAPAQFKAPKRLVVKKRSSSSRSDQDAISYISELRQSLSNESYDEFKKTLAHYKTEGDFSQLMTKLKEIFQYPSQYPLLHGFKRYVRREHKETFEEQCSQFTSTTETTSSDGVKWKVPKIPKLESLRRNN